MTGKKGTKKLPPNIYATMYEGQFDIGFDCPGTDKCPYAKFYLDPPDPDDDCAFLHSGSCTHAPARKEALGQLKDKICASFAEYESESC